VTQSFPVIYARSLSPTHLTTFARLLAFAISIACLAVLMIAAWLEPSPTGIGSHRRMGLEPCQFELRTGVPCITCGMTTSFAYFVRGQLLASLYVQPMGSILALTTALIFWTALYVALTGRPVHRITRFIPMKAWLIPLFTLTILAWMWKIWIHLTNRDGWSWTTALQ
jgi:hypothetical protein